MFFSCSPVYHHRRRSAFLRQAASIIMWLSPGKRWYVLDGGHRISVVLAWLRDDWGDKVPSQVFQGDAELEASVRDAADEVRSLLIKKNIGKFEDYGLAFERSENLAEEC